MLGITAPWQVELVELKLESGQILIGVEGSSAALLCRECGERCPAYDSDERRWRHLDTCQYRTILIAKVPRVRCEEHGVRQVRVPWSEERSRFTALFEALVIDWLQASESIAAVAKGMRLSWEELAGIRSRAVPPGLERRRRAKLPSNVGVDETPITRGHEYITVLTSLNEARVLEVTDGRTEASLNAFWQQYEPTQLEPAQKPPPYMCPAYLGTTPKTSPTATS